MPHLVMTRLSEETAASPASASAAAQYQEEEEVKSHQSTRDELTLWDIVKTLFERLHRWIQQNEDELLVILHFVIGLWILKVVLNTNRILENVWDNVYRVEHELYSIKRELRDYTLVDKTYFKKYLAGTFDVDA